MDKRNVTIVSNENPDRGALDIKEPFYIPINNEIALFEAAHKERMAVLLKGPTGCGKTRFVAHMAWRLKLPLHTVSCHDDLTSSDLVGRYLIQGSDTVWQDGPLSRAVREGGICYLDEVVEARKDTTVIIPPLSDDRRTLPIEKTGETLTAPDDFMLVISYNPGYQHILKELKASTRQRFIALEFDYPTEELELEIITAESGLTGVEAERLVRLVRQMRGLTETGLESAPGTRLIVQAARLIKSGIDPAAACEAAIVMPITDDVDMHKAMLDMVEAVF
ncbi:MAG: CbbQ/NirQ/NorQ/GpvN family protein [Proteobacteria bacterium]|nr:CbbQ/NirQ/NorQ/GpvN family protein [Pseudomonadota bacterium]